MQALPTQQPRHGLPGKSLGALRRSQAGTIQLRSNLRKAMARLAPPLLETIIFSRAFSMS